MSTKSAAIVSDFSGTLVPATHQFEITDPSAYKTVVVDNLPAGEAIAIVRENFAGDGWQPATNGAKQEVLHSGNNSATPLKPGVYGLSGTVTGVTIYTEEV